jgi:hypothetical protein
MARRVRRPRSREALRGQDCNGLRKGSCPALSEVGGGEVPPVWAMVLSAGVAEREHIIPQIPKYRNPHRFQLCSRRNSAQRAGRWPGYSVPADWWLDIFELLRRRRSAEACGGVCDWR